LNENRDMIARGRPDRLMEPRLPTPRHK
jgi:hypothetical protein